MVVLTQQQWFDKLRSFMPAWFCNEDTPYVNAYVWGMAKVFSDAHQRAADHHAETFLSSSDGTALDAHGFERSVFRLPEERDQEYRERVRSFLNTSNLAAIKQLIDRVLANGECEIREDRFSYNFFNRDTFLSRSEIALDGWLRNTFSIIIRQQAFPPESFFGQTFASREEFFGSISGSQYVYDLIVRIANDLKALGTMYRVIELTEY
jgi:hypothetical protein